VIEARPDFLTFCTDSCHHKVGATHSMSVLVAMDEEKVSGEY
jgi:hypothetical protein